MCNQWEHVALLITEQGHSTRDKGRVVLLSWLVWCAPRVMPIFHFSLLLLALRRKPNGEIHYSLCHQNVPRRAHKGPAVSCCLGAFSSNLFNDHRYSFWPKRNCKVSSISVDPGYTQNVWVIT